MEKQYLLTAPGVLTRRCIDDIKIFLQNRRPNKIKQTIIGVDTIFRGFIIKDWITTNIKCNQFKEYNKVIVKAVTNFYMRYWEYRNKVYHNVKIKKKYITKWYMNLKNKITTSKNYQLQWYIIDYNINLETITYNYITE